MCGRFDQSDIPRLLSDFSWADEVYNRSMATPCWNVAPTMSRPILHLVDGTLCVDDIHWGYRSAWGEASGKVPVAVNARLEKALGSYWAPLMKRGRVIVPANGWYEWTGEKPKKQPWHIHRKDRGALFFAGVASLALDAESSARNGFAILTADAVGGMVDVHDRRPIVFTAADAKLWLDQGLSAQQAEQLARTAGLGPEAFDWFKVGRAVGNVHSQGPALAVPLAELDMEGDQ